MGAAWDGGGAAASCVVWRPWTSWWHPPLCPGLEPVEPECVDRLLHGIPVTQPLGLSYGICCYSGKGQRFRDVVCLH